MDNIDRRLELIKMMRNEHEENIGRIRKREHILYPNKRLSYSDLINNKTYLGEVVSNSDKKLSSFFVLKNGYNSSNLQNTNVDEGEPVSLHVELPEAKYDLSI